MAMIRVALVMAVVCVAIAAIAVEAKPEKAVTELQIGVKFKPKSCELKAHKGEQVSVHYRGTLTDGALFDESYGRGQPLDFKLGQGAVIKGSRTTTLTKPEVWMPRGEGGEDAPEFGVGVAYEEADLAGVVGFASYASGAAAVRRDAVTCDVTCDESLCA